MSHLKFAAPSTLDGPNSHEKVSLNNNFRLWFDLSLLPHEVNVVSQMKPNAIRKRPSIRTQGLGKVPKQVY